MPPPLLFPWPRFCSLLQPLLPNEAETTSVCTHQALVPSPRDSFPSRRKTCPKTVGNLPDATRIPACFPGGLVCQKGEGEGLGAQEEAFGLVQEDEESF